MIKYLPVTKKNIQTGAVKWYAQIAPVDHVNLATLTEKISANCTVTEHDVKAVLSALQEQIYFHLRDGYSVRLGDLGSFRLTLNSSASDSREEVSAANIKALRVRFSPGARLRHDLTPDNSYIRFVKLETDLPPVQPEA